MPGTGDQCAPASSDGWRCEELAALQSRPRARWGRGAEPGLGPWLTAVCPQNTLIQELESSQRQIAEQHHHKVPSHRPARRPGSVAGRVPCSR